MLNKYFFRKKDTKKAVDVLVNRLVCMTLLSPKFHHEEFFLSVVFFRGMKDLSQPGF